MTGLSIVRAIVAGERDSKRLAEFRDPRVKASKETIAQSLEGTWLPEQVAVLQRQLGNWDHIQGQIAAWDADLQDLLKQLPRVEGKPQQSPAASAAAAGKRQGKPK